MANTAANDIQLNVKVINNQLAQYSVEMGGTLARLTKAMQATTDKLVGVEKTLAQERQAMQQQTKEARARPNNDPTKSTTLQGAPSESFSQPKGGDALAEGPLSGMGSGLKTLRAKISAAFSPLGGLIQDANEKWKAFATAANDARRMQAAVGHLTEGFAQMAAAIAQAVAPALAALTDGLATVLAYAGRLFGFLTGQTVKGAEGAAAAVADVGRAAGGTAQKAGKAARSLADFDEITRLAAPAGGGGSSGGGSAAAEPERPGWAAASPFLDRVLGAIEGGEWKAAGRLLAERMDGLLQSWDAYAFGQKLGAGVQHALALLSGFITGAPWGDGARAVRGGIERMLGQNQWNGLGEKLAESFNGLLDAIDPADLAAVLLAKVNIAVRTLGSFLEDLDGGTLGEKLGAFVQAAFYHLADSLASVDWGAVGGNILQFFQNLDWAGMAQALGTLLGQTVLGAFGFLAGLLGEPFESIKERFLEGFALLCGDDAWFLTGEQIIAGVLAGILNALAGIGAWIWENVFQPIAAGFCDAFGIHSPSTVAAAWGGFIIEGLLSGLAAAWERVGAFLDGIRQHFAGVFGAVCTAVAQAFTGLKNTLAAIWEGITGTLRGAVNGIIGFVNRLIDGVAGGINLIADGLNSLRVQVPSWVPGVGGARLGFNVPHVSLPHVPYLAQGAVIPANREFLAVLGDQTHGTNVEAPLATIQGAVRAELEPYIDAMMAGFEAVVNAIREKDNTVYIGDERIGRAAERYRSRMDIIRGSV